MAFLLIALQAQDPAAWIEKLRNGGLEEREEATRSLEGLGLGALPALEKAAADADAEVAGRARGLIRRIRAAELLGRDLVRIVPGAVDRLGAEGAAALFADLARDPPAGQEGHRFPGLTADHLEPLARAAAREARGPEELRKVFDVCYRRRMKSAAPQALAAIGGASDDLRPHASLYLVQVRAIEAVPELMKLLDDPRDAVRECAASTLGHLPEVAAVPRLRELLKDPASVVRQAAGLSLLNLNASETAPAFRPLFHDADARPLALTAAGRWGDVAALPDVLPCLADPKTRYAALEALWALGWRDPALILPCLKDPSAWIRELAAIMAGRLRAREALPALRALLEDKERNVAFEALRAIHAIGDRESLLPVLESKNPALRSFAFVAAGRLGHRPAAPALIQALGDAEPEIRQEAARALAALGATEAVDALRPLLKDPDPDARREALSALVALAGEAAVPDLLRLLADPLHERYRVVRHLERAATTRASEAHLLPLVDAEDVETHSLAVRFLARVRSPRTLAALAKRPEAGAAWEDLRPLWMDAAPETLLPFHDGGLNRMGLVTAVIVERDLRGLIPDLTRRLVSADPARHQAASTLGALKAVEVLPACLERLEKKYDAEMIRLLGLLGDPAGLPAVRRRLSTDVWTCAGALHGMKDPDLVPALIGLAKDRMFDQREEAIRFLGERRVKAATSALEALLKDPDESVRRRTLRSLQELEARESVSGIRALLKDPEPDVREEAVETLVDLLDRPDDVAELLTADTSRGRFVVLHALEARGGPAQGPAIAALLKDADPDLAGLALRVLAAVKARAQTPEILPLLEHEKLGDEAAIALGSLGAPEALEPLLDLLGGREAEDALEALRGLKPELLLPALLKRTRDDDRDVRRDVARLLGALGAKEPLIVMLSDRDPDVQRAALDGLARLKAADAAPRIRLLLRGLDPRGGPHAAALRALAAMGDRESIPEIRGLLKSEVARDAVEALHRLDAREAIPDFLAMLEDPREWNAPPAIAEALAAWDVREARPLIRRWIPEHPELIGIAARMGDVEAVPILLKEMARPETLPALAALGAKEAVPRIRELLWNGREEAARALRILDRASLLEALTSRNAAARAAAARELCLSGSREGVPVLLELGEGLFPLNGVRSPGGLAALAATPFPNRRGSWRRDHALERVRGSTAWEGALPFSESRSPCWGRPESAAEALEAAVRGSSREAILEKGRVRLVPADEARAFWTAWWAGGGKPE